MKNHVRILPAALALLLILNSQFSTVFAQGTTFTYQGQLNVNGAAANGLYDFRFKLAIDPLADNYVGGDSLTNGVLVTNGLFMTTINFGAGIFTGSNYWLEVDVRTNNPGNTLSYTMLNPLQGVTSTPYATYAESGNAAGLTGTIPAASLSNDFSAALNLTNTGNTFSGNGSGLTNVNALTLGGLGAGSFWQLTGNAGTTPGTDFVGTTDDQPLELHVDGERAMSLAPDTTSGLDAPSVIGGSIANVLSNGVYGATIGGGGATGFGNTVTNEFGTIAGGVQNISGQQAFVGGGYINTAGGINAVVGGGYDNNAGGTGATVPGGQRNVASGLNSFAAGNGADATNNNTFVWSDGSAPFASTAANQFLILASGGVGIGTSAPGSALEVASGNVQLDNHELFLTYDTDTNSGNGLGSRNFQSGTTGTNYYGICQDGPFLYGFYGGCLGAVDPTTIALSWDYSGDIWISNNCSAGSFVSRGGMSVDPNNYNAGFLNNGNTNGYGLTFGLNSGEGIASERTGGTTANGVDGLEFYTSFNRRMTILQNGNVGIGSTNPANLLVVGSSASPAYCNGTTWVNGSDRNSKEAFARVNPLDVLEKVSTMPITEWQYKVDPAEVKHVGPMAQDFHAAFGLNGGDDKHISTVDEGGIALAAIQGLNQKVEDELKAKDAEIQKLKQQNDSMAGQLNELEATVKQLVVQK